LFKIIFLSVISLFYFYSCTSSRTYITYISFDKGFYQPTQIEDVKLLNSRLELNVEYKEIGVIKFEGEPKIEDIISLAAKQGAMAIIKEEKNYILMIYKKRINDEKNKSI